MHFARNCIFKQHTYKDCNKIGHKEDYCVCNRGKSVKSVVSEVHCVKTAAAENERVGRKYMALTINGKEVRLQIDSRSDITVICRSILSKICKPTIRPKIMWQKNASKDKL